MSFNRRFPSPTYTVAVVKAREDAIPNDEPTVIVARQHGMVAPSKLGGAPRMSLGASSSPIARMALISAFGALATGAWKWQSSAAKSRWIYQREYRFFAGCVSAIYLGMGEEETANLNTDTPWSEMDDLDICWGVEHGRSLEETADFLCSTPEEIRQRMRDLGLS
jgi:hypothetical protein